MKIGVIGQGYVGQTVALNAAKCHEVIGFDSNIHLVAELNLGKSSIEGLDKALLRSALDLRKYHATANPKELDGLDVIVIAVPTPLDSARKPDLTYLESACKTISSNVHNNVLIINESTSYPGTVRNFIQPLIEQSVMKKGNLYAVSPERVDPGRVDWNQLNTPRLFSGLTQEASNLTRKFYEGFCNNLIEVSSPEVAEAAKLFENSFRQVNIALVNEFAKIAHALGISVRETLEAASTKPYGFMKFDPSAGVGGHCIPVDPTYLAHSAREHGVVANFIELANEVNLKMGQYIVDRVLNDHGNNLKDRSVQLVGVAYKANVSDIRESPANQIYDALKEIGVKKITWHDPLVESWQGKSSQELGGDIGIMITAHDAFYTETILSKFNYVFDCTGKFKGANQL